MCACKITQITIMRGQYYFNWNLHSLSVCSCSCEDSRVPPLNLYYDVSIAEDLQTVKKTSWSNQRQTRICYIFQLWVIIEALLKIISLYLLSHFRIRIIMLTCPDNKSARNHQPKSCVLAMQNHTKSQWCEANIISIEIFAPFQFVPVRVKTREYYH